METNFLTENECYRRGVKIRPCGVMVHSTGADNPSLSRYVGGPGEGWNVGTPGGRKVCPHAFIGRKPDGSVEAVQTLPWTMRGWHSGRGKYGSANDLGYIGFEICEDDLSDKTYFEAVYRKAVELTAMLCGQFHLDPKAQGVVICHSEGHRLGIASNHADVMHWFPRFGKNMDRFRADAAAELDRKGDKDMSFTYEMWKGFMERYRRELANKTPNQAALLAQAKAMGLTDGTRPGDFATREECAVMARAACRNMGESA